MKRERERGESGRDRGKVLFGEKKEGKSVHVCVRVCVRECVMYIRMSVCVLVSVYGNVIDGVVVSDELSLTCSLCMLCLFPLSVQ